MLSVFNGPPTLNLATSAQVTWGNMKLRVALVLDNTGSMLQGSPTNKITALKSAAHQLLSQLQAAAAQPGDVQVAIVPFTTDVNVDPTNVNASWIDWSDWNSNNQNCTTHNNVQTCTPKPHSAWNGVPASRWRGAEGEAVSEEAASRYSCNCWLATKGLRCSIYRSRST